MSVFNAEHEPADVKGSSQPPRSLIFVVEGQPLKFFIQKDIPNEIREQVQEQIQALGGTCEMKVPIRGFIIYQPGSQEAQRLRDSWQRPERPERHFVPFSWIEASIQKGKPIPQIFVDKTTADPIKIHIHPAIANPQYREELSVKIANYGGEPCPSGDDARIILAPADTDFFREMRRQLQGNDQKYIEHLKWLETCMQQEMYYNSPNPIRNPGGRRPGDERTAFSEDDEVNLCNWIASVIPYKESGGRTGNKIYQELVSRANLPGYEWVGRHTWQSWRERYKKNALRLDQHIAAIVNLSQTNTHDKAQFGFFKLTEGRQAPSRKRKRKVKGEMEQIAEAPVTGESGTMMASQAQSSQESEWAIKVGDAPTPDWAKRSVPPNGETTDEKQIKDGTSTFRTFVLAPPDYSAASTSAQGQNLIGNANTFTSATEFAADFGAPGAIHPIDRAILDIAQEFHFMPDEVRAFYERTRDLNATRQRFGRMRAVFNTMP